MARYIQLETKSSKTYATKANAIKAAQEKFGGNDELRFIVIQNEEGRFFPLFLGGEVNLKHGVHFHFHCS